MTDLKLFHFPGACSRVTIIALEEIGCPYDDVLVDLPSGAQTRPEYRAINPKGKIPALLIGSALLTENVAILSWLNQTYPHARLLPATDTPIAAARQLSTLVWISAMWHPYVRANMMPIRWTTGDPAPVRARGKLLLEPLIAELDEHLGEHEWYFGQEWSIVDTYIYWCYTTAEEGQFSLDGRTAIARHRAACEARPSFARMLAREQAALNRSA